MTFPSNEDEDHGKFPSRSKKLSNDDFIVRGQGSGEDVQERETKRSRRNLEVESIPDETVEPQTTGGNNPESMETDVHAQGTDPVREVSSTKVNGTGTVASEGLAVGVTGRADSVTTRVAAMEATEASSKSTIAGNEMLYKFLDPGVIKTIRTRKGIVLKRRFHNSIEITTSNSSFVVRHGDAVFMVKPKNDYDHQSSNTIGSDADDFWVSRVDGFYVDKSSDSEDEENCSRRSGGNSSDSTLVKMVGCWFFNPKDLRKLLKGLERFSIMNVSEKYSQASIQNVFPAIQQNELVLCEFEELHDIASISGLCIFQNSKPTTSENPGETYKKGSASCMPALICRYKVNINFQDRVIEWSHYEPQTLGVGAASGRSNNKNTSHDEVNTIDDTITSHNVSHYDDVDEADDNDNDDDGVLEDDDDENDDEDNVARLGGRQSSTRIIQEGEGSTLRGDIAIGDKFQITVLPYDPNDRKAVASRNPKLIWTPANGITNDQLHQFLTDLALLHNSYLRVHGLIVLDEPYSPLPWARAEQVMRENLEGQKGNIVFGGINENIYLTGSQMSSASMLAADSSSFSRPEQETLRNGLLRECDVDKVLELLADHNFDTRAALRYIKKRLSSITTTFNRFERAIFDAGYRLNQASSLREISKALDKKNMKDVIDYHYRFKVPDQYRKFQDKKREKAIQVLECIEHRKAVSAVQHESSASSVPISTSITATSTTNTQGIFFDEEPTIGAIPDSESHQVGCKGQVDPKSKGHWSEKTIGCVIGAKDKRIRAARQLLIDIKEGLGISVMKDVARVVRQLEESYDRQTRDSLFQILDGHPELQNRFLDFLPASFHDGI